MSKKIKLKTESGNNRQPESLISEKFDKIQEIIARKKYSYVDLFKDKNFVSISIEENLENRHLQDLENLAKYISDLKTELDRNTLKPSVIGELKENFLVLYKKCQEMGERKKISTKKHEDFSSNIKPLIQYLGKKEIQIRENKQSRNR